MTHPDHHIEDDTLLSYAAGCLSPAASIVVASHMSLCPRCRAAVAVAEVVGGTVLEDISPAPLSERSSEEMLARLDQPAPVPRREVESNDVASALGIDMPKPLRDAFSKKSLWWRWVSPGVRFAEVMKDDTGARLGLLRIQPGASIAQHGHSGDEMAMVLSGGYRDGSAGFRRGDAQAVDESVVHAPVGDNDGPCLALLMTRGPIRPTRFIAKIFRHLSGF